MSLMECPECGEQVSSFAEACPHCGCPGPAPRVAQSKSGVFRIVVACTTCFLVGVALVVTYQYIATDESEPSSSREVDKSLPADSGPAETLKTRTRRLTQEHTASTPTPEQGLDAGNPAAVPTTLTLPQARHGSTYSIDLGNGTELALVYVAGGSFQMGSPSAEQGRNGDESPVHWVSVGSFWIGESEVTIDQYRQFLLATGDVSGVRVEDEACPIRRDASFSLAENKFGDSGNQPMVEVSWEGAKSFCGWLSRRTGCVFRLPTEAEWEYACRAGSGARFCFGNSDALLGDYAWYRGNSGGKTRSVRQKRPNRWGLYDMHGNVWEWCEDWYDEDYYARSARHNPLNLVDSGWRVLRGGRWGLPPSRCRSADRIRSVPTHANANYGFRVVAVADATATPPQTGEGQQGASGVLASRTANNLGRGVPSSRPGVVAVPKTPAEETYQRLSALMKRGRGGAAKAEALWRVLRKNHPSHNRVGCGALYLARMYQREGIASKAADMYRTVINQYYNCRYGDKAQVGPLGKYYYAMFLAGRGHKVEARALLGSIVSESPDAVNHAGKPLGPIASEKIKALR